MYTTYVKKEQKKKKRKKEGKKEKKKPVEITLRSFGKVAMCIGISIHISDWNGC